MNIGTFLRLAALAGFDKSEEASDYILKFYSENPGYLKDEHSGFCLQWETLTIPVKANVIQGFTWILPCPLVDKCTIAIASPCNYLGSFAAIDHKSLIEDNARTEVKGGALSPQSVTLKIACLAIGRTPIL